MTTARISVKVDGEMVLKNGLVGDFMGALSDPPPERSPFAFHGTDLSCLFTAHLKGAGNVPDGPPVGYFLPRGTNIVAALEDVPAIPPGAVVRVGGAGFQYSPDVAGCGSAEGACRT